MDSIVKLMSQLVVIMICLGGCVAFGAAIMYIGRDLIDEFRTARNRKKWNDLGADQ